MQRGKGRGVAVCSNVQTAVESKPKRMVANAVPNDRHDRDGLRPLALQATAILGGPFDAGAEVGSDHGEAVQTGRDAGSPPDAARPSTSAKAQLGLFSTEDCRYDQAPDPDPCPAGA